MNTTENRKPPYKLPLVTQRTLEDILMHEGIIPRDAIENPEHHDGGITELKVSIAARALDEAATANIEPLLRGISDYFGETNPHPLAVHTRAVLSKAAVAPSPEGE